MHTRGRGNRIVVVGVQGGRNELRRCVRPGGRSRQPPHIRASTNSQPVSARACAEAISICQACLTVHSSQTSLAIPPSKPIRMSVHTLESVEGANAVDAPYSVEAVDGARRSGIDSGKEHKGDSRADIGKIDTTRGRRNV